jgi:hypothetical protein
MLSCSNSTRLILQQVYYMSNKCFTKERNGDSSPFKPTALNEVSSLKQSDEIIHTYTRAQAIADGILVDASEMAKEAGLKHPVALTRKVFEKYVEVPAGVEAQDETGRLWDILYMLRVAAANSNGESEILFQLYVRNDNQKAKLVTLKSVCGPGDNASPHITVMLPNED